MARKRSETRQMDKDESNEQNGLDTLTMTISKK